MYIKKRVAWIGGFVCLIGLISLVQNDSKFPIGTHPAQAIANGGIPTQSAGYQQYTSLSSSTPFSSVPSGAWYAVITVESAGIRWRDDGTAPTASVGMPVAAGSTFYYTGSFAKFAIIQQTSGAIINVSWYR